MSFHERLPRELAAVGISGRLRARILAEFDDHLASDPQADLGNPRELARQFADELGTSRARRAAVRSFVALALAGILFAVVLVSCPGNAFGAVLVDGSLLGRLATAVVLLAPQVAFVAGVLAVLRVLQRRSAIVLPAAEAAIIVRRAAVGLGAGTAGLLALAAMAIAYHRLAAHWWLTLALAAAGAGLLALTVAAPSVLAAARVAPVAGGPPGDIFDDLGAWAPPALSGRPWRLALLVATAVAVAITASGVAASDGYDGALRGIVDALLCLLGFATLGRYLGLWSPQRG
jgi:hypothetical protein